jgi:predicted nucleic acid-binding protein
MIVVSDTTPLRYLVLLGQEEILHTIFGTLHVPPEVLAELSQSTSPELDCVRRWAASPPEWIVVQTPAIRDGQWAERLDPGEAQALALALELDADWILIDERRGRAVVREVAQEQGRSLQALGTLAVLEEAAVQGLLGIEEILSRLRIMNFRASERLYEMVIANVHRRIGQ